MGSLVSPGDSADPARLEYVPLGLVRPDDSDESSGSHGDLGPNGSS